MLRKKNLWLKSTILSSLFLLIAFTLVDAKIIYMAPSPVGNDDTGDGSLDYPFATLKRSSAFITGAFNYTQIEGDTIILLAGAYPHEQRIIGGTSYFRGKDANHPLVIMGEPVAVASGNKPYYDGNSCYDGGADSGVAIMMSRYYGTDNEAEADIQYLIIKDIDFKNFGTYAVNIDDGGSWSRETPAHHIKIEGCSLEAGPCSPRHCLKISGLNDFEIKNCEFSGMELCGIDAVGCHDGHIHNNIFRDGQTSTSDYGNGITVKGGSRNLLIENNLFLRLNCYGVQIGQTTGQDFLRPPACELDADGDIMNYEAKNIDVFSNLFIHVSNPITWCNAIGGRVYQNTFYTPNNRDELYGTGRMFKVWQLVTSWGSCTAIPCQGGEFRNNIAYYGDDGEWGNRVVWVQSTNTIPDSFIFSDNLWYCHTDPSNSQPDWDLIEQTIGTSPQHWNNYTGDPLFVNPNPSYPNDFYVTDLSPAIGLGALLDAVRYDYFGIEFKSPPTLGGIEATSGTGRPSYPNSVIISP